MSQPQPSLHDQMMQHLHDLQDGRAGPGNMFYDMGLREAERIRLAHEAAKMQQTITALESQATILTEASAHAQWNELSLCFLDRYRGISPDPSLKKEDIKKLFILWFDVLKSDAKHNAVVGLLLDTHGSRVGETQFGKWYCVDRLIEGTKAICEGVCGHEMQVCVERDNPILRARLKVAGDV